MKRFLIPLVATFTLPTSVNAGFADLGVNITPYSFSADKSIYITDYSFSADKKVYVAGKCSSRGSNDIYLTDYSFSADETWYVTEYSFSADFSICLSGDIEEWFEKTQ